ncbi:MAG TPA: phytanoyl-CoA dioxygenase family protein, partial [Acidimicrobiales bacterium]|nr:phytanoyl-CoA dioxygenase family protein [Acidimicrobiales bacterium]
MITRSRYLSLRTEPVPPASIELEEHGFAVLPGVFSPGQVAALRADIDRVFDEFPPDVRGERQPAEHWLPFRYEMLNRSEACQRAVADPAILQVIEPLLGEDCHVIANTAWRQPPAESSHGGRFWHIDSGPHIPRPAGVPWDFRIPYPIFAIAAHIMLQDCPLEAGPTAVIPGSHTSGQFPPLDRLSDDELTWDDHPAVP